MRSRLRPLLVNAGEVRTDAARREAAAALGDRVRPKVRVADVLDIERSGLSNEAYSYALRSHFDWVVYDAETNLAEFAVEFDGASHDDPAARRRDATKNEVCAALGLPLLRIDRTAYRPTARRTVIGYLVESWAAYRGFCEGQKRGDIPADEIFMPWAVLDVGDDGQVSFRDISGYARRMVERLHVSGQVTEWGPTSACRGSSEGDREHAEGFAWVGTPNGQLVVGHARIRAFSFPAVGDSDLAEDLALLDLADRLSRLTEGDQGVLVEPKTAGLPALGPGSGWSWGGPVSVADIPPG